MDDVIKKAKMFESEEIAQLYIMVRCLIEWQKETGCSLEDFAVYMDEHFAKRK